MGKKKIAGLKDYAFHLTRNLSQEGEIEIQAASGKKAEEELQRRLNEGDQFGELTWSDVDVEAIDWEADFDADEEA